MAWWIALAVALVVVLSWYAWWTARRLDRLHSRLDAAAAALDDQLVRRAEASSRLAFATRLGELDDLLDDDAPVDVADWVDGLADSARAALVCRGRLDHDREVVENALGDAIHAAVDAAHPLGAGRAEPVEPVTSLLDQATRAAFARRFYNDAVRDVLVVRDRRVVRWLHLAGRAPLPSYLEMDDGLLPSLPSL